MQAIIDIAKIYGPGFVLFVVATFVIYKMLQGSIDGLKKSNEALSALNGRFSDEIKEIRSELRERREEAKEEREQSKKDRESLKQMENTVNSLRAEITKQGALIKEILSRVANLTSELLNVKEQHNQAFARIDDISSSLAEFTHQLERNSSIDPAVLDLLAEKLEEHNLELIRLKQIVRKIAPRSMDVHSAISSVLKNDDDSVSAKDLEVVLQTMLDEE